jgi:hypothetical protein
LLGPLFRDEGAAEGSFAADAYACEKTEDGELPDAGGQRAGEGEDRIAGDGEG